MCGIYISFINLELPTIIYQGNLESRGWRFIEFLLEKRGLKYTRKFMDKKIRLLLAYKAYPFCIANYYIRALQRRNDVEIVTCGEFFGQSIPWANGMQIPMKYHNQVDIPLPVGMSRPSYSMVAPHLPWKPDLILGVDAGFHFLDKPDVPYAVVSTDPHVLGDWYADV